MLTQALFLVSESHVLIPLIFIALSFGGLLFLVIDNYSSYFNKYNKEISEMELLIRFQFEVSKLVMPANDFLIEGSHKNEVGEFKQIKYRVDKLLVELNKLKTDDREKSKIIDRISREYAKLIDLSGKLFEFPHPIGNKKSGELMEKVDALADSIMNGQQLIHNVSHKEMSKFLDKWDRMKRMLLIIVSLNIIFILILVSAGIFIFKKYISKPIRKLKESTNKIGNGDLEHRVKIEFKDEIGALSVSFDEMTEKLQKTLISRNYLDSIFQSMVNTIIIVNPDARIRTVNKATLNLLNYNDDRELIGKPIDTIIKEEEY